MQLTGINAAARKLADVYHQLTGLGRLDKYIKMQNGMDGDDQAIFKHYVFLCKEIKEKNDFHRQTNQSSHDEAKMNILFENAASLTYKYFLDKSSDGLTDETINTACPNKGNIQKDCIETVFKHYINIV